MLKNVSKNSSSTQFVNVILPLAIPKTFTYRLKDGMLAEIGKRVIVQFGKKKIYTALIVEVHNNKPQHYEAKHIIDILDDQALISSKQLEFWYWIADYYCCTIGEVMDAALPSHLKLQSETSLSLHPAYNTRLPEFELSENEYFIIEALMSENEMTISRLSSQLSISNIYPYIKSLTSKGVLLHKEALKSGFRPKTVTAVEIHPEAEANIKEIFNELESAPKQSDLLLCYLSLREKQSRILKSELIKKAGVSAGVFKALEEKKVLIPITLEIDRINEESAAEYDKESEKLNEYQEQKYKECSELLEDKKIVLLHGITGSGKTHIYIKLIKNILEQGLQALYLVPEIVLTTQLINKLRQIFGKKIGIYHSRFSDNERLEIWNKVSKGEYQIVLGVRSALFLPFENPGLIVIDEEHENTYKQNDPAPKYHARDAAIYLARKIFDAKVILGTATPSLESMYNAKKGKFELVEMQKRFIDIQMPEIILADLAEDHRKKMMKSHFSSLLFKEMQAVLKSGKQLILFQNRRGYAPYLECQMCGWVPYCDHCDISMTYHNSFKKLMCHYCGSKSQMPASCKACGSSDLIMKGFGTEKIEDELGILFPEYESIRMDQDAMRGKQAYSKAISEFERGEKQIMVGTQMVAKGLDFENVELVGILNADSMLRYPDFRAYERCFQLITQVSGRAGRRQKRGKVIVQTFNTTHPVFHLLINNDYNGFYNLETGQRQIHNYPPYCKLIRFELKHIDRDKLIRGAQAYANLLRVRKEGYLLLGPEFPMVSRIKNRYIMQILLKINPAKVNVEKLKEFIKARTEKFHSMTDFKSIQLTIDVDPY